MLSGDFVSLGLPTLPRRDCLRETVPEQGVQRSGPVQNVMAMKTGRGAVDDFLVDMSEKQTFLACVTVVATNHLLQ